MRPRTMLALAGGATLGVAAAGALWQRRGEARDRADYPAPGAFADVDGYQLHYLDEGSGAPTVVLDSGLGGNLLSWELVAPAVAEFTRVVRFDRPGLGWSDPAPAGVARTPSVVAHELRALLRGAGVPGPFVLVGWSLGGLHVRAFASLWPDEVAGLVLVDASHERQFEQLPPKLLRQMRLFNGALRAGGALAEFGAPRALAPFYERMMLAQLVSDNALPADALAASNATGRSRTGLRAVVAETTALPDAMADAQASRATTSLPPVPVIVITRGAWGLGEIGMSDTWQALQADQAALSPRGRQVVAERSGHLVPLDRPDLVIDAIREIVEQTRSDA
jgi:pimeloyl-ACP methyl ester carboxylesterase